MQRYVTCCCLFFIQITNQKHTPEPLFNHEQDSQEHSQSEDDEPTVLKTKRHRISFSESEDESSEQKATIKKKRNIAKHADDTTPLPDPFPLPKHYPVDIESALQRKCMSQRHKRQFMSEIASAMLRFKTYPTREDYVTVARSIIHAYPFLKSPAGKPYVSFFVYFIVSSYDSYRMF